MRLRLLLVCLCAVLLVSCGRKGPIEVPTGQQERYTYPGVYPAPETVVPQAPGIQAIPAPGPATIQGPTDEGFEDVEEELDINNP